MISSWEELLDTFGSRPGMWVGRTTYPAVCGFMIGFATARDDTVLGEFQQWLSAQPQHRAISNYFWTSLIINEAFPARASLVGPAWVDEDTSPAAARWPRPPAQPMSDDDLLYPDEHALAVQHLIVRLREFLESTRSIHPE